MTTTYLPNKSPAFGGAWLGLQVRHNSITICLNRQRRGRLLFWRKHWHTTALAEIPYTIGVGDTVTLRRNVYAYVNRELVLAYPSGAAP